MSKLEEIQALFEQLDICKSTLINSINEIDNIENKLKELTINDNN